MKYPGELCVSYRSHFLFCIVSVVEYLLHLIHGDLGKTKVIQNLHTHMHKEEK